MTLQAYASQYIGQKEIPPNKGFVDPEFEKLMKHVGWRKALAWCAYFVKLVMHVAHEAGDTFSDLVSPSAVATYNAYKRAGRILRTPKSGSLAVWQMYKGGIAQSTGHIGIVADFPPTLGYNVDVFYAIEGNTDEDGSRDGEGVALKQRKLTFAKKRDGLVLLGFCDTQLS